jgi:hypothetical protein
MISKMIDSVMYSFWGFTVAVYVTWVVALIVAISSQGS